MSIDTFVEFILLAGIIQGFGFNVFVFFSKNKLNKAMLYLNLSVLSISLNNIRTFLFERSSILIEKLLAIYLIAPWHLFVVPMFYAFLVYYLKLNGKIPSYLRLVYGIFIVETCIRISFLIFYPNVSPKFGDYIVIEEIVNALFSVFIFYKIIRLVFYEKDHISEVLKLDNIRWIKNILRFGFFLMGLWIATVFAYYFTRNAQVYDLLKILSSLQIYWLGYEGLYRSNLIEERISLQKVLQKTKSRKDDLNTLSSSKTLSDNKSSGLINKFKEINSYLVSKQRFLDPNLSMEKLSQELGLSISYFSKVINSCTTYNFSDYINSFRVEHSKSLLSDDLFDNYTVVAIGLESGFNSKSTFYSAFKKFTLKTPTEFRTNLK